MKGTYDPAVDAAYLYRSDEIRDGEVAKTVPLDPHAVDAEINLDFDRDRRLIGIEVLGASRHLRSEVLASLTRLS